MGLGVLSKLSIATTPATQAVKKLLFKLLDSDTVAAVGSDDTDAILLSSGRNLVTGADGAVGVKLPVAVEGMVVEIINTVSNQDLLVYPNTGAQINALTVTTGAFTLVAGASRTFYCDVPLHWYVGAGNLSGTATTASTAELNYNDITTLGTLQASKVWTSDASLDTVMPTGGKLTVQSGGDITLNSGSTLDVAGTFEIANVSMTASAAELNYNDISALGTGAASKAVVLDAGEDYVWPATGILTYGVLKDPAGSTLGATVAEINAVADVSSRVVSAAGPTLAVTAALHGGRIVAFDQTGGTAATLPAATGTGNVYHFVVKVKNTSSANTIVLADASDLFQGQVVNTDADATTPVSYTANAAGDVDTISLNGTTTGGQIGDWIEVVDIASNVYAVRGFVVCPVGSNVATPLLTGQVS